MKKPTLIWSTKKQTATGYGGNVVGCQIGQEVKVGGKDPLLAKGKTLEAIFDTIKSYYRGDLVISTRSGNIHRSVEFLTSVNKRKHKIRIHILNQTHFIQALLEPSVPSISERLESAVCLQRLGMDVTVVLDCIGGVSPSYNEYNEYCETYNLKVETNTIHMEEVARLRVEKILRIEIVPVKLSERQVKRLKIEKSGFRVIKGGKQDNFDLPVQVTEPFKLHLVKRGAM